MFRIRMVNYRSTYPTLKQVLTILQHSSVCVTTPESQYFSQYAIIYVPDLYDCPSNLLIPILDNTSIPDPSTFPFLSLDIYIPVYSLMTMTQISLSISALLSQPLSLILKLCTSMTSTPLHLNNHNSSSTGTSLHLAAKINTCHYSDQCI